MDPNAARERMIEAANKLLAVAHAGDQVETLSTAVQQLEDLATELAEAVHNLDEWLRSGGFLPDVWTKSYENVGRLQDVDI